jgi:hypothetical protein
MKRYHKLYKVIDFEITNKYTILVQFNDNSQRVIDFEPVLFGEMWGPLRDPDFFRQVELDPIAHTLTWPNGADFDPETLYNWPDYVEELSMRARRWVSMKV